jgi:hypothetical protein
MASFFVLSDTTRCPLEQFKITHRTNNSIPLSGERLYTKFDLEERSNTDDFIWFSNYVGDMNDAEWGFTANFTYAFTLEVIAEGGKSKSKNIDFTVLICTADNHVIFQNPYPEAHFYGADILDEPYLNLPYYYYLASSSEFCPPVYLQLRTTDHPLT